MRYRVRMPSVPCVAALAALVLLGAACRTPPFGPGGLRVTSGSVDRLGGGRYAVDSGAMRAVAPGSRGDRARLQFTYRGPSRESAPLASGELRRQIGLKLRARDTCNVVYAMWRIEPSSGVAVQVKSNPGQSRHAQCGDRGYETLDAGRKAAAPAVAPDAPHVLEAAIDGGALRVVADGVVVWEGRLPASALAFDGPAGVRSDNGAFEFWLDAPGPR